MNIILASGSPRRKELLESMGLDFTIEISKCDEDSIKKNFQFKAIDFIDNIRDLSEELAKAKAKAVFQNYQGSRVIGADTMVAFNEKILDKPIDANQAIEMLHSLSGQTHQVVTGVAIISPERTIKFSQVTEVDFYPLDDFQRALIDKYVQSGSPLDKAGAYGIQDLGAGMVREIRGDFFNVVGLPIAQLVRLLN